MAANASGRANRVAPDGSTHAVSDRGDIWGNRGRLLNVRGEPARHSLGRNWLCCVLEFKGRHRDQWRPDRLTELYFLDEATAFAAGHRPCGECRHHDYQRFKRAWAAAFPDEPHDAAAIDRHLHRDRLDGPPAAARHRTHRAVTDELPDGVIVEHDAGFWLLRGDAAYHWTFGGYDTVRPRRELPGEVAVRTPRATVETLRAGYEPACHVTAG